MEKFQEYRDKAIRHLKIADHMFVITYPFVKDPKLLLTVLNNIFESIHCTIGSLLHYERLFKRINLFGDGFEEQAILFKQLAKQKNINPAYIHLIDEIREIISEHRKSAVEFARKEKFVICSDDYKMKTVSLDSIKKYIAQTKLFIEDIGKITSENEGIFK